MDNLFGRYYFKEHETDGYSVYETNQPGTPDSFIGWGRTEEAARELSQRLCIEDLQKRLKALQELQPDEFKALWTARCLPNSGVHYGMGQAPGYIARRTQEALLELELLHENPKRPGFYILTYSGRRLIGEDTNASGNSDSL